MQFTKQERSLLAKALTIAIELWKQDMRETRDDGFPRLAAKFGQQLIDGEQLLARIEQEN